MLRDFVSTLTGEIEALASLEGTAQPPQPQCIRPQSGNMPFLCYVRACTRRQEELFALPFIGWVMASHGGIPINRRHRASAVQVSYIRDELDRKKNFLPPFNNAIVIILRRGWGEH